MSTSIPVSLALVTLALLLVSLGVAIPALVYVAQADENPRSFTYNKVETFRVSGPIYVNGSAPTNDIMLNLDVGTYQIKYRVIGTLTDNSSGTDLDLYLTSSIATGFYGAVGFPDTTWPVENPLQLDYSNVDAPSNGVYIDSATDLVIQTTSALNAYIGLEINVGDTEDTFTVDQYEVMVFTIA